MAFEFVVSQPFQYEGVDYVNGDVIVGAIYTAINADPHYSSGNYVIRRVAEDVPAKSFSSPPASPPSSS